MRGQRHAPAALYPREIPGNPCTGDCGPQGRSEQVRKISPPPGLDPQTVQPVASRLTDWATRPNYFEETDLKTKNLTQNVKFVNPLEAVTVVAVKITVFWDVTPCSVSRSYEHFIGTCFLHLKAMRNSGFHQDLGVRLPNTWPYFPICGPGSVVGIATGYGLHGPGIQSRWGRDFPHLSGPALGSTQPPVHWVPGLSRGKERPGRDTDPSPSSSAVVKKG